MFPGAIPQCDEEEIKKGRLYGSLKLHLKSAMTFCREMANERRDLTYHQLLKIAQHTETDSEDKEPSRCQEDRGKIHHSSSKPMFGTVYPNHSSFSDNYLLSRVTPEVPAGKWIGKCMCGMCLLLPTQPCLLVANRHPQD